MRLNLLQTILGLAVVPALVVASQTGTPSMMAGYDLNLAPMGYTTPPVPIAFRSPDPVEFTYGNPPYSETYRYTNGADLYRTMYRKGWGQCLGYYLYPHMATWVYSETWYPSVAETLPEELSQEHINFARQDGFKSCSERIALLISTDPELRSRLLTPTYRKYYTAGVLLVAFLATVGYRFACCRTSGNNAVHAEDGIEFTQMESQPAVTDDG